MRKGTKVETNVQTIIDTAKAGIAVQLQNFIGFPSETLEEATQTVDQLVRLRQFIASFALGTFHLMPDSLCARESDKFGIVNLRVKNPKDIHPTFQYDVKRGMSQQETKEAFKQLYKRLMRAFPYNDFFYDGPVGSHVMLYLERQRYKGKNTVPFTSPNPDVSALLSANLKIVKNHLTIVSGQERNLSIFFHNRSGECIPILNEHLDFIMQLDGSVPIIEKLAGESIKKGTFDEPKAVAYAVVTHDMLSKEVIALCQ
jgi:hypothetical protein